MDGWPSLVIRTLLPLTLCMQVACATAQPAAGRDRQGDCSGGEGTLCSSYHATVTHLFLALGRGDMAAAMSYLSLLTGLSVAQQQVIINGLTHFFDEGNQVMGRCGDVARGGFQSLSRLGEHIGMRPYFLKIISTDGV